MKKVNLGCGPNKLDGYINVDLDPRHEPDVVSDVKLLPFETNSIDVLEAYHVIEHLSSWEADAAL